MALPRFVSLKSKHNDKYLRYMHEDGEAHGLLQFSGEDVMSPYAKYQVEMAECGKGLVHIRCCYNNKLWVRQSESSYMVSAAANQPEEDKSKWSCTLFKPSYLDPDADHIIRLRHVQLDQHARLWVGGGIYNDCLSARSVSDDYKCNDFTVIDWESLLILPKHIMFKGDNGKYLSSRLIHGENCLRFDSCDIVDAAVTHTVFTDGDGYVRIKSDSFDKYWMLEYKYKIYVHADHLEGTHVNSYFVPIRVENNVIALRCLINNEFCSRRVIDNDFDSCLASSSSIINKLARFEVEEAVLSRRIYNVNFRLNEARIYNENVVSMASGEAVNMTENSDTVILKLSYKETKSSTWNNSVGVRTGVKTELETGIPYIFEGKIKVSSSGSYTYGWGESMTSTNVVETVYVTATVPKKNKVKVSLMATQGSCYVPYSYTQRDTLFNGKIVTYDKDDGFYTGINFYNFAYETEAKEQPPVMFT